MRLILNPRRSPRVPARLRVRVGHAGREWEAETAVLGPKGCVVVTPQTLDPGAWVRLLIDGGRLLDPLTVGGRVAWVVRLDRWISLRNPRLPDPDKTAG